MLNLTANSTQFLHMLPSIIAIFVGIVAYAAEKHYTVPMDIAVICLSILGNIPAMWLQFKIFSGRAAGFDKIVREVDPGLTRRYIVFGAWISEAIFTVVLIVMVATLMMPDALKTAMAVNVVMHAINILGASYKYYTVTVEVVFGESDYQTMRNEDDLSPPGSQQSLDMDIDKDRMLAAIGTGANDDDVVFSDD